MKTFSAKAEDVVHSWVVVDAQNKVLGRLASQIAMRLRGKHKPEFTPHVDTGDFIVVLNAAKIRVTGRKEIGKKYYRHTTFEFQGGTLDSAQNALGGGGRYDGLVESLGGPATHGIGFALGLDRTLLACDDEGVFAAQPLVLDAFVVDTTGGVEALQLTAELRAAGLTADRAYENRSMKAQMKVADRSGAAVAVIIGSNELAEGAVTVRPLRTADGQQSIARSTLIDYLKKARQ